MKARPGAPNAGPRAESLTLQLEPALSEYLRREAASQAVDPAELASRLLMRGLHTERLDEFASDVTGHEDAWAISKEGELAARIEAAALLAVLSAWRGVQPENAAPEASPSLGALRELLERPKSARHRR